MFLVCAELDEFLDCFLRKECCGVINRSIAVVVLRADVEAGLNEQLDHVEVLVGAVLEGANCVVNRTFAGPIFVRLVVGRVLKDELGKVL